MVGLRIGSPPRRAQSPASAGTFLSAAAFIGGRSPHSRTVPQVPHCHIRSQIACCSAYGGYRVPGARIPCHLSLLRAAHPPNNVGLRTSACCLQLQLPAVSCRPQALVLAHLHWARLLPVKALADLQAKASLFFSRGDGVQMDGGRLSHSLDDLCFMFRHMLVRRPASAFGARSHSFSRSLSLAFFAPASAPWAAAWPCLPTAWTTDSGVGLRAASPLPQPSTLSARLLPAPRPPQGSAALEAASPNKPRARRAGCGCCAASAGAQQRAWPRRLAHALPHLALRTTAARRRLLEPHARPGVCPTLLAAFRGRCLAPAKRQRGS